MKYISEEELALQMQIDKLPKPDCTFNRFLIWLCGFFIGCWLLVETGFRIGRWCLSL